MMPYSAQLAILDLYIPCPPPPPPPPPPSNHHRYSEDALGDQLSDMDLAIDTMVWDADREQQQPGSDDCGSSSSSSSSSEARAQVRRMQEAGERRFESLEAKVERLRSRLGMRRRVGEDGAGGDGEGEGRNLLEIVVRARSESPTFSRPGTSGGMSTRSTSSGAATSPGVVVATTTTMTTVGTRRALASPTAATFTL